MLYSATVSILTLCKVVETSCSVTSVLLTFL
jgi:hypothetical protein